MRRSYYDLRLNACPSFFSSLSHKMLCSFKFVRFLMKFSSFLVIFYPLSPPLTTQIPPFTRFTLPSCWVAHASINSRSLEDTFAHLIYSKICSFLSSSWDICGEWSDHNSTSLKRLFVCPNKQYIPTIKPWYPIFCIQLCSNVYFCWKNREE